MGSSQLEIRGRKFFALSAVNEVIMKKKVAILGASNKPERYAHKAYKMLQEYGHETFLVHPSLDKVEDKKVYKNLSEVPQPIDTLTMYVGPQISSGLIEEIRKLSPRRIIFNPGSENEDIVEALGDTDIQMMEACTLVLLRTGQF